ncbi:MAG: Transcriptional regulator, MerR family [Candidatus Giovannonibacteria bacterium GW2011_GWC2_44_8]|uniref:Transcriptional regulator, MerR family n=1 Tax=Candidatus Giovannonibacteria bacterium GW2011_GWC2_44_8 TaxID=1618657 RepID=A0A0G1K5H9_9BACT|nr:MAG: Transcriptional regulator, MerR family [Candidatus Giovannonibacteria bacterium GW2011_GWC2_44_8]
MRIEKDMADNDPSKFITIKVAAEMLGVSPLTLRNWDKRKKLTAYRHPINNYRVYKLVDIQNFLTGIENTNKPRKIRIDFLNDDPTGDDEELKI